MQRVAQRATHKRICVTPPTLARAAFPRFVALRAAQPEAALPEPGVRGSGVVAMKGAGKFLCWRAGLGRTRALCRIWLPFRGLCVTRGPLHVGLLLRAADPGLSAASSSTCHAAHPPPATPCTHPAARNAAAKAASIQSVKRRKQKGRGEHACAWPTSSTPVNTRTFPAQQPTPAKDNVS